MRSTNSSRHLQPRALAMKTLLSVGAAATALAVCDQACRWTVTAIRASALATLSALFMTASMSAQAPATARRTHAESTAPIASMADAFSRAVVGGDPRAVAALFTPDGSELPPGQPAVKGRAAIEQRYRAFFTGPAKVTAFTISPIESAVVGDLAYTVGTYVQQLSLADGKTTADVGKYVVLLKRAQGEWKIAYSTYNGDSSTAPMPCSGH
jgi:uncharacterized protein (TIGR02246 family)